MVYNTLFYTCHGIAASRYTVSLLTYLLEIYYLLLYYTNITFYFTYIRVFIAAIGGIAY